MDWTSTPDFCPDLANVVAPIDVRIGATSRWMPRGPHAPKEARLETFGPEVIPEKETWQQLREWWLAHKRGANTPNWDLAVSCEIECKAGLVLVEAKANVPELSASGKILAQDASDASRANHERIGLAIDEACAALKRFAPGTVITRDSHYQLANRAAFAWKLASLGIPTVLVYLGFLGDHDIADAGEPFRDETHWNDVFATHASSAVPPELFARRLDCGTAPAWFLVRSRSVLAPAAPRLVNRAVGA